MYVQGVSTRKIKAISEELCGHEFSASTISELNKTMDAELEKFARQRLEGEYPYLILDARYEKVREDGVIRSRAMLVAIGIDWEGRRRILGVELAGRESTTSWREFVLGLKQRGLSGVRLAICQRPPALPFGQRLRPLAVSLRSAPTTIPVSNAPSPKSSPKPHGNAVTSTFCAMLWTISLANPTTIASPNCAGFRTAATPPKPASTCAAGSTCGPPKHPKLCSWVEENIEQTWTFYRQPREHHKHIKSTNLLERLNQEIKRRTHVVRIFPNEQSCLRLIRALACEQHEEWLDGPVYLDMQPLRDLLKSPLQIAA